MKKFLLMSVALIVGGAAPAIAADMPARVYTKAPPVVAPIYNWGGFYIGVNGGGGWDRDDRYNTTAATALGRVSLSGGVAGGQIGYRWQQSNWVFGLEAQGDWADITGRAVSLVPAVTNGTKIDAFGLFTGQVGYAWNNVLLYAKGGAAVVDQRYDFYATATNAPLAALGSSTRWGGTIGAGIEIGFAPQWSVAFEYDHIFLGDKNGPYTLVSGAPTAASFNDRGDVDIGTVRLNYTFGGPIVARY